MMENPLFLKVGTGPTKPQERLYMMHIILASGMELVKFGKSSGVSSKRRMLEVCEAIYEAYPERRTPSIKLIRDRKCDNPFVLETVFKEFFTNYQYTTKAKWCGSTECYVIPVEDAKQTFDLVIEGEVPPHVYQMPDTKEDEDTLPF